MRYFRYVFAVALVIMCSASFAGAPSVKRTMAPAWLSDALDNAGAERTTLPRAEFKECVASFKLTSKTALDAVAAMPIDLSRPLTVIVAVGQGFESTAISAIGFDKAGTPMIAFDDLSSREHQVLSATVANELDMLARTISHGEAKPSTGVQDGECILVIRKDGSRLFPPGYDVAGGQGDALRKLKTAINNAFSEPAGENPP